MRGEAQILANWPSKHYSRTLRDHDFGRLTLSKTRATMPETSPQKSFAAKHLPPASSEVGGAKLDASNLSFSLSNCLPADRAIPHTLLHTFDSHEE